jgi:hypothetical protein
LRDEPNLIALDGSKNGQIHFLRIAPVFLANGLAVVMCIDNNFQVSRSKVPPCGSELTV